MYVCSTCTQRYEGKYSVFVYAQRAINIIHMHADKLRQQKRANAKAQGLFIYLAWQAGEYQSIA